MRHEKAEILLCLAPGSSKIFISVTSAAHGLTPAKGGGRASAAARAYSALSQLDR